MPWFIYFVEKKGGNRAYYYCSTETPGPKGVKDLGSLLDWGDAIEYVRTYNLRLRELEESETN